MAEVRCGTCGLPMSSSAEEHFHFPDFALKVWNCQASLVRFIKDERGHVREEELPFTLPDELVDFTLFTCGGAINMSGLYRLPGLVWEWVIAMMNGDTKGAQFIERKVAELFPAK